MCWVYTATRWKRRNAIDYRATGTGERLWSQCRTVINARIWPVTARTNSDLGIGSALCSPTVAGDLNCSRSNCWRWQHTVSKTLQSRT